MMNHLGIFLVEAVDLEARTAVLRRLESNAPLKDVEWNRIWPLDNDTIDRLKAIAPLERLRQMVEDHDKT